MQEREEAMIVNVTPCNDLRYHKEDSTCPCKPKIEFVDDNILIVHNSFDGREAVEQAEALLREISI